MKELMDRAAYLRGLADGMELDASKKENKLLLELVGLVDEMAKKLNGVKEDVEELEEYVDDLDTDLADMEDALFGDEDDACADCEDEDCENCDLNNEALSFDCPHCGETVMLKASDIDFDESPVCANCGKPFFTDAGEDE